MSYWAANFCLLAIFLLVCILLVVMRSKRTPPRTQAALALLAIILGLILLAGIRLSRSLR